MLKPYTFPGTAFTINNTSTSMSVATQMHKPHASTLQAVSVMTETGNAIEICNESTAKYRLVTAQDKYYH